MNDLINILKDSKSIINYQPDKILNQISKSIKSISIDWDEDENWISFIKSDIKVAILNVQYPILFVLKDLNNKIIEIKLNQYCKIISCESFHDPIWYVDINKFNELFSKLKWHASLEAVNPNKFSIDDFWYATI